MLPNKQLQNLFYACGWSDSLDSRLWVGITSPHDSRSQTERVMIIWSKFFSHCMVESQENWGNLLYFLKPQLGIVYCHFSIFIPLVTELWLPSKRHCMILHSRVWGCDSVLVTVKGWKKIINTHSYSSGVLIV